MLVSKRCGNLAGLEIIPVIIGKIEYQKESFTSYKLAPLSSYQDSQKCSLEPPGNQPPVLDSDDV